MSAQIAVADTQLSLETLFSSMPVAMCLLDREGRHLALNEALAAISGRPLAEHLGLPVSALSEESGRNIQKDFAVLDAGGEVPDHEIEIRGKVYHVSVRGVRDEGGQVIGLMVAMKDITGNKEIERQLAEANEKLKLFARLDHLTELPNRRAFDEILDREVHRALRLGQGLVLGMVDVDHFKTYNDTLGHVAGDDCLRKVARALRTALRRAGDEVCRYGGEEFAVILPGLDEQGAEKVGAALVESVSSLGLAHGACPRGRVTISVGLACLDTERDGQDALQTLTVRADQALYRAKEGGRNRACLQP